MVPWVVVPRELAHCNGQMSRTTDLVVALKAAHNVVAAVAAVVVDSGIVVAEIVASLAMVGQVGDGSPGFHTDPGFHIVCFRKADFHIGFHTVDFHTGCCRIGCFRTGFRIGSRIGSRIG